MNKTYIKEQVLKNLTSPHLPEIIDALLNEQSPSHTGTAPLAAGKEVEALSVDKIKFIIRDNITANTDNWGHYGGLNDKSIQACAEEIHKALSPLPVNSEGWIWTDTLVLEYATRSHLPGRELTIQQFKELKLPPKTDK